MTTLIFAQFCGLGILLILAVLAGAALGASAQREEVKSLRKQLANRSAPTLVREVWEGRNSATSDQPDEVLV